MVEEQDSEKIPQKNKLIAILGPTATGKTLRAVDIASHFGGEILSADSRQVYRGMNLGTGKDLEDYGNVPYHLIDICEAGEKYNLHRYVSDFYIALENVRKNGSLPILCGGSGLYLETVLSGIRLPQVEENIELRKKLENYDLKELAEILSSYKNLHNITDIDTKQRAIRAIEIEEFYKNNPDKAILSNKEKNNPLSALIIGIDIDREERRKRITHRLHHRLKNGMVEEVETLLKQGISADDLIYYGLEYKYLTLYVTGVLSYDEMVKDLEIAIHQFAKRQMTWFRGMERRGFHINWIPYDMERSEFIDKVKLLYFNSCPKNSR